MFNQGKGTEPGIGKVKRNTSNKYSTIEEKALILIKIMHSTNWGNKINEVLENSKKRHGCVKIALHEEEKVKERRSIATVMDSWREKKDEFFLPHIDSLNLIWNWESCKHSQTHATPWEAPVLRVLYFSLHYKYWRVWQILCCPSATLEKRSAGVGVGMGGRIICGPLNNWTGRLIWAQFEFQAS